MYSDIPGAKAFPYDDIYRSGIDMFGLRFEFHDRRSRWSVHEPMESDDR
jgi:hypothetical protein